MLRRWMPWARFTDYQLIFACASVFLLASVAAGFVPRDAQVTNALRVLVVILLILASLLGLWAMLIYRTERQRRSILDRVVDFEMAGKWKPGFANVAGIYEKPWYIMFGKTGVGKSKALKAANLPMVLGPEGKPITDSQQGANGTFMFDWWFFEKAVVLDSAGELIESPDNRWQAFLQKVREHRPIQPVNGMILAVSALDLTADDPTVRQEMAKLLARQVQIAQEEIQARFPLYILVTKADLITGFADYFPMLADMKSSFQIVGWSNSQDPRRDDTPTSQKEVREELDQLAETLRIRRSGRLKRSATPDPKAKYRIDHLDEMFAFPTAVSDLVENLQSFVGQLLEQTKTTTPPFLRGIYFTSALQTGQAMDSELQKLLGLQSLPKSRRGASERAYFLRDLFLEKILPESGMVTPLQDVISTARKRGRLLVGGGILAASVVAVASALGYYETAGKMKPHREWWNKINNAGINGPEKLKALAMFDSDGKYVGDNIIPSLSGSSTETVYKFHSDGVSLFRQDPSSPLLPVTDSENKNRQGLQKQLFEQLVLAPAYTAVLNIAVPNPESQEVRTKLIASTLVKLKESNGSYDGVLEPLREYLDEARKYPEFSKLLKPWGDANEREAFPETIKSQLNGELTKWQKQRLDDIKSAEKNALDLFGDINSLLVSGASDESNTQKRIAEEWTQEHLPRGTGCLPWIYSRLEPQIPPTARNLPGMDDLQRESDSARDKLKKAAESGTENKSLEDFCKDELGDDPTSPRILCNRAEQIATSQTKQSIEGWESLQNIKEPADVQAAFTDIATTRDHLISALDGIVKREVASEKYQELAKQSGMGLIKEAFQQRQFAVLQTLETKLQQMGASPSRIAVGNQADPGGGPTLGALGLVPLEFTSNRLEEWINSVDDAVKASGNVPNVTQETERIKDAMERYLQTYTDKWLDAVSELEKPNVSNFTQVMTLRKADDREVNDAVIASLDKAKKSLFVVLSRRPGEGTRYQKIWPTLSSDLPSKKSQVLRSIPVDCNNAMFARNALLQKGEEIFKPTSSNAAVDVFWNALSEQVVDAIVKDARPLVRKKMIALHNKTNDVFPFCEKGSIAWEKDEFVEELTWADEITGSKEESLDGVAEILRDLPEAGKPESKLLNENWKAYIRWIRTLNKYLDDTNGNEWEVIISKEEAGVGEWNYVELKQVHLGNDDGHYEAALAGDKFRVKAGRGLVAPLEVELWDAPASHKPVATIKNPNVFSDKWSLLKLALGGVPQDGRSDQTIEIADPDPKAKLHVTISFLGNPKPQRDIPQRVPEIPS